ncbi:MAG: asparagine synthetase B family protein, partial [Alphaproteobacteria bacterium]
SGDGGDELFAGYNRYFWSDRLWRWMRRIPRPARGGMARTIRAFSPASWDRAFRILPPRSRPPQPGDKLYKAADILPIEDPDAWYRLFVTHWDTLVPQSEDAERELRQGPDCPEMPGLIERMQFLDLVTYLPDDILTKVDRASMGASLEARVPILDHRVVEFAWRLPTRLKVNGGQGKWLLRQVLYRHVPRSLIDRPKMGFGVPIDRWLRGPLRDWAEDLLDERQLRDEGFVDADAVRRTWNEHLSGDHNWQYHLWDVLVFQAWKQRWLV